MKEDEEVKTQVKPIPINISPEEFQGFYTNFAYIRHTKREFILDFIFRLDDDARLVSRIIMNPEHIKDFQRALNENIKTYLKAFGEK